MIITILKNLLKNTDEERFKNHMTGRLIILNKSNQTNPDIKNLRPITAISPIRKIIENNIIKEL